MKELRRTRGVSIYTCIAYAGTELNLAKQDLDSCPTLISTHKELLGQLIYTNLCPDCELGSK